jgi:hypothetical protein
MIARRAPQTSLETIAQSLIADPEQLIQFVVCVKLWEIEWLRKSVKER